MLELAREKSGAACPPFKNQIDGHIGGNCLHLRLLEVLASRVRVTPSGFSPVAKATGEKGISGTNDR